MVVDATEDDGRYKGPFPGQQTKFFQRTERWVLYGGAGGGGKTVCLIGKFAQQLYVEAKRFEAGEISRSRAWGIYLRRNTTDLKQAIDIAHWIFIDLGLCTGDDYNINDHIFTFPACGNARFQFGHMEHERSKYKYKSNSYTYICPDEVTEFTETQIEYIDTRLRTTDKVLEPMMQICCGSNPDGVGLLWVRNKFIEGKVPETVYRNETVTSSGKVINFDQVFIPAKLRDNPVLYESGVYEAALMNKRPEVREAILEGNWYISAGSFLGEVWDTTYHVCPNHDIPRNVTIARSGDFGTRSPTSITWWYIDRDGAFTAFHNIYVKGLVAERVAEKIKEVEQHYGLWDDDEDCSTLTGPLDEDCFNKANTSGPSIAEAFRKKGVRWRRSNKNRLQGAAQLISRLVARIPGAVEGEPARPMIRWMERCTAPIRTLPILMPDENDPNVPDTKGDDHCFIAGTMVRTPGGEMAIERIQAGDLVETDEGPRPVIMAWLTKRGTEVWRVDFDDGTSVTATPGHKFVRADGAEVRLRDLSIDEMVYAWPGTSRSTRASNSTSAPMATGALTSPRSARASTPSIERSGGTLTAPFRQIMTSIMTTMTARIIHSAISSCASRLSTGVTMGGLTFSADAQPLGSQPCTRRLPNGTDRKPEPRSTVDSPSKPGPRSAHADGLPAESAERDSTTTPWADGPQCAATGAAPRSSVKTILAITPLAEPADVFNLHVSARHRYYANGTLVLNCYDETTYMCLWRPMLPVNEEEQDDDDAPVVDIKTRRRYSAGGRLGEPPGGWGTR